MDNIRTIYCDLPTSIGGFTVATIDDYFIIVINQNLSYAKNLETYRHELEHIQQGDFDKQCSAGLLEIITHSKQSQ